MPKKSILLAVSFLAVALGATFTISASHACCKEQFTRSKPHVNVSTTQSQQNTAPATGGTGQTPATYRLRFFDKTGR